MANYLHGAYGVIQADTSRVSARAASAVVYVGTAPVHLVAGGSANVNKPIVVEGIADARRKFGYSDDFAKYTLCEAMKVHFEQQGVGPLIFINVLDPATHKSSADTTKTATPDAGRIKIAAAEDIILDTISVSVGSEVKELNKDYIVSYDFSKKVLTIADMANGALGTGEVTIKYRTILADEVDEDDIIGTTDGEGANTGLYAVRNVYPVTGYIPSFLLAPGFSSIPAVHAVMQQVSTKINDHWDAYLMVDLPLVSASTQITLANAKTWKDANGYNKPNETVYFPMAQGIDGTRYHISVLAAANFQKQLVANNGIPYKSASNTACDAVQGLYMGADSVDKVFDDAIINARLNQNGIASAAYIGGRWVVWGAHSASYDQENGDAITVAETNRMMLYYISNDFQHRRMSDVDKPLTQNDIQSMIADEQARLDALVKIGALTYGDVHIDAQNLTMSDIVSGDYTFTFNITTTPLAKSLTAIVNWTEEGFITFFETFTTEG